ncbi:MAG: glutamate synthase subunit beta [Eubacteriales bacterium]|nr:glutamate synthase subunit beta [Eubacteriales bacterium]
MGKSTGFLDYSRKMNPCESVDKRIGNFREFHGQMDKAARMIQGGRCMNCGLPFCQTGMKLTGAYTGCPLHNLIPEWNDEIWNENWNQALARLLKTNPFPEFTGRVCPALCESACTEGLYGEPVSIRENELAIVEEGFKNGQIRARIPSSRSGKKVAVIGSGPAGLACADRLNQRGHLVTVFEKADRPGGLLMYGIPNMKLDKKIVLRRIRLLEEEGIEFRLSSGIAKSSEAKKLEQDFDAVVLCCGAEKPRDLDVEGRNAEGVRFAVDFLTDVTKELLQAESDGDAGSKSKAASSVRGKNVIIIGGGDTGNDCVGTCVRLGAASVHQLVRKPRLPKERTPENPWPEHANVEKTDYGQEESIGVYGEDPRIYQTKVKKILHDEEGHIQSVVTIRSNPEKTSSGKLNMVEIPGSEETMPCDLLLLATGFSGCDPGLFKAFGVEATARGSVATKDGSFQTGSEKIFSCGDAHRGASLVVHAISEGRSCAKEVDEYLMGYTNLI